MKHIRQLGLLLILASSQAFADVRDVYGYIVGAGTNPNNIVSVKIVRNDGVVYYADRVWNPLFAFLNLRWDKRSLETNRDYRVWITTRSGSVGYTSFALWPGTGAFKAPDARIYP